MYCNHKQSVRDVLGNQVVMEVEVYLLLFVRLKLVALSLKHHHGKLDA